MRVEELIGNITNMGVIIAIEHEDDYWFVSGMTKDYDFNGIAESSLSLETALERVENRLLTEGI